MFRCSSAASCLRRRTATTAFTTSVSAIRVLVTKRPSWYLLFHPTKYRSESISILSSPEPSWSGFASVKSPTWRSRPSCINNPCILVADAPCLEQQPFWQWCESSFRSYLLGELILASPIRFLPTVSGPWSARDLFSVDLASVLLRLT